VSQGVPNSTCRASRPVAKRWGEGLDPPVSNPKVVRILMFRIPGPPKRTLIGLATVRNVVN